MKKNKLYWLWRHSFTADWVAKWKSLLGLHFSKFFVSANFDFVMNYTYLKIQICRIQEVFIVKVSIDVLCEYKCSSILHSRPIHWSYCRILQKVYLPLEDLDPVCGSFVPGGMPTKLTTVKQHLNWVDHFADTLYMVISSRQIERLTHATDLYQQPLH